MNRDTEKYECFYKEGVFALTQCLCSANKEKFLGPSIMVCFPGIRMLCPAHLPASAAISQELCAGSPGHHKSLFVEQELQQKHLLLKNNLSYLLGRVSNSRRMEESGIRSEEYKKNKGWRKEKRKYCETFLVWCSTGRQIYLK